LRWALPSVREFKSRRLEELVTRSKRDAERGVRNLFAPFAGESP